MRYLLRLVVYLSLFFVTYSICSVLLLRAVPVTVTPLKVLRFFENFTQDGFSVHSNWVPFDRIQAFDENREGKRLRGGSTISQQTAKNVFCFPSRTWLRKGFEAYYTVLIECCWSKRRIMETYLNVIETGRNMYGVEAPAREVYGKSAKELNRYENYMVRRAARVRTLMNMVGEVDLGR